MRSLINNSAAVVASPAQSWCDMKANDHTLSRRPCPSHTHNYIICIIIVVFLLVIIDLSHVTVPTANHDRHRGSTASPRQHVIFNYQLTACLHDFFRQQHGRSCVRYLDCADNSTTGNSRRRRKTQLHQMSSKWTAFAIYSRCLRRLSE